MSKNAVVVIEPQVVGSQACSVHNDAVVACTTQLVLKEGRHMFVSPRIIKNVKNQSV